jgi:HD-like signal output (HDOD) protein/ActR/RegA family two-component response regulator
MTVAAERDQNVLSVTPGGPFAEAGATKRILFVDEQPDTFASLKEVMRRSGPTWNVEYAAGGAAALAALEEGPVDVVIAEERMSPMDGVTLLTRLRDRHPMTIRMILSEAVGSKRPSVAAIIAHRFLGKPCNVAELGVLIRRSCDLRDLTGDAEAYRRTMSATALPSSPGMYMELSQILSDPTWQPSQVSAVIERDVAMSAKVLQLANSALFGLTQTVTSVRDAVVYLGGDTIRSLALTAEAFGKLAPKRAEGFSIDAFQNHAMLVARIAAAILPPGRAQQEAVTASLLHDIGKLIVISDGSNRWKLLNLEAVERRLPLYEVEHEREGVTHAELGAYLLSLWGLPDGIVEAVAHHHNPGAADGYAFDGVAVVHIADALAHELQKASDDTAPAPTVDEDLLDRLGMRPRLDLWRHMARQLVETAPSAPTVPSARRQ